MAKLPSQNRLATRLRKTVKDTEDRMSAAGAAALQKGAVSRGNREQAREAKEMKMMKKPMKKYAKGGKACDSKMKKYAKGGTVGKADGIAKKGKTHTKMVKMAMGGLASRGMMRPEDRGGPAKMQMPARRATFKKGGSCGMKKGK